MSAHDPSFIKRYKISHTCDVCLRRKTHCDGPDVPGHRCSTCLAANIKCSYTEGLTKRESDKDYVRALEERLGRMEALLLEIHQSSQKAESQAEVAVPARSGISTSHTPFITESMFSVRCDPLHILQDYRKSYEDIDSDSDDDNSLSDVNSLSDYLAELKFDPFAARFMGKSSGTTLLKSALELKYKHFRRSSASGLQGGPNVSSAKEADITTSPLFSKKRPEYWEMQEWERQAFGNPEKPEHNRIYVFPEQDLLDTLVHRYFEEGNSIMPLLHRPSFEAGLTEGLHFRDDGFARVLLLVCAIGSGYVDDPRVLLKDESGLSSGWRWFSQITLGGNALLALPSLYDLQVCCLASVFLQSSSAPHIYWTLMGTGIRIAQEIGIHRRKVYSGPPNVYDEQWKRAFWMLVVLDRCTSWFLGRPGAIRDEDLDLDLPLEVDDEYWDHSDPARRFQQPAEKPARVTVFIHMIKLTQILGFALRTIYSIKRTRHILHTTGADWEEKNVSQLNLALMQWMDALPSHLRWDANQQNMLWFQQSTFLYASYYVAQLTIYRPFLPDKLKQFDLATEVSGMSPSKLHALAAPALAICTSAARSCAHVIHEHSMRTNTRSPMHIGGAFHAGAFILLNVWTSQKIGNMSPAEISSDMQLVKRCIDVLRACENTWAIAGKYRDLLNEVAGEQSLPGDTSSSSAGMGDSNGRALEQDSTTFLQPTSFHSDGHLPHETNDTADTAQYLESLFSGTHTVPSTQIYKGMPIDPTTDGIFEQLLLDWGWSLDKTDVEFPQAN